MSRIKSGSFDIDADTIGRWQYGGEEIDLIAYSTKEDKGIVFEVKWKELSYDEAKKVITRLIEKSYSVRIGKKYYGLIAKKIIGKERLCKDGFLAFNLEDLVSN